MNTGRELPKFKMVHRLMVLMCQNTDLADGWERAGEDTTYKRKVSEAKAFPMGINIVYYALTSGKANILYVPAR
jgi:hypothetical protein